MTTPTPPSDLIAEMAQAMEEADTHWQDYAHLAQAAYAVVRERIEELVEWAFERSALNHRLAHENEALRTEHIASSSAYRELALELRSALKQRIDP